jgi:transglutaminase-like putative cysteine protease
MTATTAPMTAMTPARRVPGLSLVQIEPLLGLFAAALATLPLLTFYGSLRWLPAVIGALLVGGVLAGVVTVRKWPGWLVVLSSAAVAAVYALYSCYPGRTFYGLPGADAVSALGTGLTSGWARMLSVALPADVTGDVLIMPVVLAFAAGLAGTLLTLRTNAVAVLAGPPLILLVAGLAVTAERPGHWIPVAVVVLLAVLLLLLVRANRVSAADREGIAEQDAEAVGLDLSARRWRTTLSRTAFGLPVIVLVTGLGVGGAQVLPIADGSHRADPRKLYQQDFQISAALTPLVEVKPQLQGPTTELFRVKVSETGGSYPVDRVRTAALDTFDGALWTQTRDFLVSGSSLPSIPGRPAAAHPVKVSLDVRVDQLPLPFLPVVGDPVTASGADQAFDPVGGTLVSTRPAVGGYAYQVTGDVQAQSGIGQARAAVDQPQYRALPSVPPWVQITADTATRGWNTPWTQLSAIEKFLFSRPYSLDARPGHSYGAVYRTLLGAPEEQVGYAEQYASAFAILARAKGYEARVAVGYRLRASKKVDGWYRVDGTDAHAWPEVLLAGYGWVPFEPTNTGNPATTQKPRDQQAPVLPNQAGPPEVRAPVNATPNADVAAGGLAGLAPVKWAGLILLILLVLIPLLIIGATVLVKAWRRRRRRRRGPPAVRIAAAWDETADRLRERGVPVPRSATPLDVARAARSGPASPAASDLAELAPIVTTAVCAPQEPVDAEAERAWQLEAGVRKLLAADTPLPVRVRELIDPRALLPVRSGRSR